MRRAEFDPIVNDYLQQLARALTVLPRAQRRQLLAQVTEHVRDARDALPDESELAMRDLLDRVGSPEDLVAEFTPNHSFRKTRRRYWGIGAGIGVAVLIASLALAISVNNEPVNPTTIPRSELTVVPMILGKRLSVVESELVAAHLRWTLQLSFNLAPDLPHLVGSVGGYGGPPPNLPVKKGTVIHLIISEEQPTSLGTPALYGKETIGFGEREPSEISLGGDEGGVLQDLTWNSWGNTQAVAHGIGWWWPTSGPVSAGHAVRATVVAFDPMRCDGTNIYGGLEWYFPSKGETFVATNGYMTCGALTPPKS